MHYRAFLAAVGAACLAVPPLPTPANADDASAIIAKHAAYVGHADGLVLVYRLAASGPSAPKDAVVEVDTTYRRGALYRTVAQHNGVSEQEGFTGRALWSSDENGYTVLDLEDTGRELYTLNLIDASALADVPATARPAASINGAVAEVVRIAPESGMSADIAFDRATGAYLTVTIDPDHRYFARSPVRRYGKYAEVAPGVRVPETVNTSGGPYTLTDHTVRAVTNDDLRGPVPSATWDFASTDATPIDLIDHPTPYAFLPRGQAVHVHATINGKAGTFLLDSGAGGIIVYRPFADSLGLAMLGETGFSGVNGGGVRARYARATTLKVGGNTLSNVILTVAPPAPNPDAGSPQTVIDGILGYDFLAGALVDVDLAQKTIRVLDPSAMEPSVKAGAYAFPVNLASRQPEIALRINNVATRAYFDTGDDFLAILSDDLKSSGRVVALTDTLSAGGQTADYTMSFMGVDGPSQVPARCSRLNEIEVGPYRYQNVETCFGPSAVFGKNGGLIGIDFLRHFNWTFDYVESKLVLTPNGK